MTEFPPAVVDAVLAHMNGDHTDDNILIARAFGDPAAVAARMTGVDATGGRWEYETSDGRHELTVPWRAPIRERSEIRREVVAVYEAACVRLGVPARPH